ncbi:uncharacterized protein LOC129592561 [Paramacrobiotus metropolitanus]|uniref:uncharacterized protein LOC129592561 n=1 Tax=Paramacrobiotus metropolitanus TaxID=2943436 RepID=UPI0024461928|nr:uncharacterized protein LOC129592561 [Paramacrobiotus metropolitanus]
MAFLTTMVRILLYILSTAFVFLFVVDLTDLRNYHLETVANMPSKNKFLRLLSFCQSHIFHFRASGLLLLTCIKFNTIAAFTQNLWRMSKKAFLRGFILFLVLSFGRMIPSWIAQLMFTDSGSDAPLILYSFFAVPADVMVINIYEIGGLANIMAYLYLSYFVVVCIITCSEMEALHAALESPEQNPFSILYKYLVFHTRFNESRLVMRNLLLVYMVALFLESGAYVVRVVDLVAGFATQDPKSLVDDTIVIVDQIVLAVAQLMCLHMQMCAVGDKHHRILEKIDDIGNIPIDMHSRKDALSTDAGNRCIALARTLSASERPLGFAVGTFCEFDRKVLLLMIGCLGSLIEFAINRTDEMGQNYCYIPVTGNGTTA